MVKSHAQKSRKSLYLLIAFILLFALGYGYYRSLAQPSNIFVIEETPITYGDTVVTGTLRKDTVVGQSGNYLLVLNDGRPILLDAQGLDGLLGSPITATGFLSPAVDSTSPMTMTISTITVAEAQ